MFEKLITDKINQTLRVKQDILKDNELIKKIDVITRVIVNAYRENKKVILFGNGGSAADAQHLAGELVGKFYLERKALAAIALTTNTSELTAIANDYSFNRVFARQIEALVNPGDIVIGITTSGNSLNVIEGIKEAKLRGAVTIGFTGASGGKLKESIDYLLAVPSEDTPHIQESHIMIGHIICYLIEKELFGG